jgi:hypothetical protein
MSSLDTSKKFYKIGSTITRYVRLISDLYINGKFYKIKLEIGKLFPM